MAVDPVCKMNVDERNAKHVSAYQGQNYYFCSRHCKELFDKTPQKYVL
ncbi:MAG: YHS domain-containing protein [Candidatus Caldarchaeum sp.]